MQPKELKRHKKRLSERRHVPKPRLKLMKLKQQPEPKLLSKLRELRRQLQKPKKHKRKPRRKGKLLKPKERKMKPKRRQKRTLSLSRIRLKLKKRLLTKQKS